MAQPSWCDGRTRVTAISTAMWTSRTWDGSRVTGRALLCGPAVTSTTTAWSTSMTWVCWRATGKPARAIRWHRALSRLSLRSVWATCPSPSPLARRCWPVVWPPRPRGAHVGAYTDRMRTTSCFGLVLPIILVVCTGRGAPPEPAPLPIAVIELRGDDDALGAQHGQQLGEQVRGLNQQYLRRMVGENFDRVAMASRAFAPYLSPHHLAEVKALAGATHLNPDQMMLAQCFLDLDSMAACSTITLPAAASPDGVARFARNLDFPSLNIADKSSVVLVFHPKDRNAFVAVTWPGLIGVLSGMNEHGLTLAS